ncbi:hypothetical protein TIFTF001_009785 [Ficus carica]|uniref:Non-specific lipid-transfer protein n=1 Tax=Ficus carica TaxID=3494 RepID=A0AA87ZNS0_FICCA|nr:hypothetical protein TIFTF001_009785 [Ficus carica]
MASSAVVKLVVCLAIMAVVVGAPLTNALTCGHVQSSLVPCVRYLKGSGGTVPPACCNQVKSLNSTAKTPADRQNVCKCLKSAYRTTRHINLNLVANLPGKCGVKVPNNTPIHPSTDCTRYIKYV